MIGMPLFYLGNFKRNGLKQTKVKVLLLVFILSFVITSTWIAGIVLLANPVNCCGPSQLLPTLFNSILNYLLSIFVCYSNGKSLREDYLALNHPTQYLGNLNIYLHYQVYNKIKHVFNSQLCKQDTSIFTFLKRSG